MYPGKCSDVDLPLVDKCMVHKDSVKLIFKYFLLYSLRSVIYYHCTMHHYIV